MLADRWGGQPWGYEDAPADRAAYYVGLLVVESEHRQAAEGLPPDEPLIEWDDEG
jgi:hypothetical protein